MARHQFVKDEVLGGRDLLSVMFCSTVVQTFPFFQQGSDVVPQQDAGYADPKDHAWLLSSHLLGIVRFQHLQLLLTLLTNRKRRHRAIT